jgi:flagellar biosynthesis protein FliR
MSDTLAASLSVYVLVFCRIGAVFVLLPGFASARVPTSIRLLLAIVVAVALTPVLASRIPLQLNTQSSLQTVMFTELLIGLAFGFWCFCFLHASRFAANIIASTIGLSGIPGQPMEEQDASGPLPTLLSLVATILIFAADLHLASLAALIRSYESMPLQSFPTGEWLAQGSIALVKESSVLALQIASPFIVLAVVVNLALGLCGKFTPQLQIYFAAMGLTILVSLLVLMAIIPGLSQIPLQAYSAWLSESLQ